MRRGLSLRNENVRENRKKRNAVAEARKRKTTRKGRKTESASAEEEEARKRAEKIKSLQSENKSLRKEIETMRTKIEESERKVSMSAQRYDIVDSAFKELKAGDRSRRADMLRVAKFLEQMDEQIGEETEEGCEPEFLKMQMSKVRCLIAKARSCISKNNAADQTTEKGDEEENCIANISEAKVVSPEESKSSERESVATSIKSPDVRRLRTQLFEQRTKATALEDALQAIRKDQNETEGFQRMERKALEEKIAQLQSTLEENASKSPPAAAAVSPRRLQVRIPDDVANIVRNRGVAVRSVELSDDPSLPRAADAAVQTEEEATKSEAAAPASNSDDTVARLEEELADLKKRTDEHRECLEAQLEELTAELQEKMEQDETELVAERQRLTVAREALETKLKDAHNQLEMEKQQNQELATSRDEMKIRMERANDDVRKAHDEASQKIAEQAAALQKNIESQKLEWKRRQAALMGQLDELCDIAEMQEKRIDDTENEGSAKKKLETELDAAKVELGEMRKYILAFKGRADRKVRQLKSQVEASNADIELLDKKLLKVHRTLCEILRRGQAGTIGIERIMSAVRKTLESIALQKPSRGD